MTPILTVKDVEAGYGHSQVLFGPSLSLNPGEVVSLMGRNGMGKTTLVRCIMGLLPIRQGEIQIFEKRVNNWPSNRIARLGVGLVPEGRQIFRLLNVEENLLATSRLSPGCKWTMNEVHELFPILKERSLQASTTLSGGEQQMLSIGRALLTNPTLLILDEATEGLAPLARRQIWLCIKRLKEAGLSILLIDKNLDELLELADRHYILDKGRVVWTGPSSKLQEDPNLAHTYLGL